MNLCQALRKSRYVTTDAHNGIITPCGGAMEGFYRIFIDQKTNTFISRPYTIGVRDLMRDDWVPCVVNITCVPIVGGQNADSQAKETAPATE